MEPRRGLLTGERYDCLDPGTLRGDTSEEGDTDSGGDGPAIMRSFERNEGCECWLLKVLKNNKLYALSIS